MATNDEAPRVAPTLGSGGRAPHTVRAEGKAPTAKHFSGAGEGDEIGGLWLPDVLAEQYRILRPLPAGGAEATVYLVEDREGTQGVAKVYHLHAQIKDAVLRRICEAKPPHVIGLNGFGKNQHRWWEIQEYAAHGSLRQLIDTEGPKLPTPRVHEIVCQIHEALAAIHALEIEHRDLKPANVLVRSRAPLDLAMTDFGISSVMDRSARNSGLGRTSEYCPPEGLGVQVGQPEVGEGLGGPMTLVVRTRWDHWSLGMMAVEMLTGRHPYAKMQEAAILARLLTQNVDDLVEGVIDPNWRKLCRGLLRRDPFLRWGSDEVARWLKNPEDPALRVPEETVTPTMGFRFVGQTYSTMAALGDAFYSNWQAARRTWKNDRSKLLQWIQDDLGQPTKVDEIEKAVVALRRDTMPEGDREDAETLAVALLLAPRSVPRVNGVELSIESIAMLTDRAINESSEAGETASAQLKAIVDGRLLRISGSSPDGLRLLLVGTAQENACRRYDQLRAELARDGVSAPPLSDSDRIRILAAQLPDSRVLGELRERGQRGISPDAKACEWFGRLGQTKDADAGTLMILPHAIAAAERTTRQKRESDATATRLKREAEDQATRERRNERLVKSRHLQASILMGGMIGTGVGTLAYLLAMLFNSISSATTESKAKTLPWLIADLPNETFYILAPISMGLALYWFLCSKYTRG